MNWNCDNCMYATDDFNKVWNHCKSILHVMCVIEGEKR